MKQISAMITPESNVMAALNPFVMLVSIRIKKTGPIIKLRKKPNDIPVKNRSMRKKNANRFKLAFMCEYKFTLFYLIRSIVPAIDVFSFMSLGFP